MSTPAFDPFKVTGYGTTGQDTARKMNEAVTSNSLKLIYNTATERFTILASSNLSKEALEKIFAEKDYAGWRPQVVSETDSLGNRVVRLICVMDTPMDTPFASATHRTAADLTKRRLGLPRDATATELVKNMGRSWTRDDYARELVTNIRFSLDISLHSKRIIDVGCRSGENALAMQALGAEVIGIDPDPTEFTTAKEKGMKDSQLMNVTLQEFRKMKPEMLFDIATVFLWSIVFKERESFVTALKEIIQPDGCVIIGYADELYDKPDDIGPSINLYKLMKTAFHSVKRTEFPRSLNRYMLVCTGPY